MTYSLAVRKNIFLLVIVIGSLILVPTLFAQNSSKIFIEDFQGSVQIIRAGQAQGQTAVKGDVLNPNDQVQTGDKASAKIIVEGTSELTLKDNTTWSYGEYSKEEDKTTFSALLALGRLKAKVQKLPKGSIFEVKTPTSVAAVRGTTFGLFVYMIAQQYFTQLEVFENAVAFSNLTGDQTYVINEGQSSVANETGTVAPPQAIESQTERLLQNTTAESDTTKGEKSEKGRSDEKDKNKALGGNPPGGGGSLDKGGRGPADSTPPNGDLLKGDDFQSSTEPTATEEPFASETSDNFFNPDNFTAPEPIATTSPGQTDLQQQTVGSQTSVTGTAPGTGPVTTPVTTPINSA